MSPALAALVSHWRRRPLQMLTLVAGLALATGLWSGVQAINAEARAAYAGAAGSLEPGRLARLVGEGPIPPDLWPALRRQGWLVSPLVEGTFAGARVVGIDPLTAPASMRGGEGDATADSGGLLPLLDGAALAAPETLATLPLPEGVTGIAAPGLAPGTILTSAATARALTGVEGDTALLLDADQPLRRPPLAEVAPGLRLVEPDLAADPGALTGSFHLNLTAFGLLSFAVGLFITHGAAGLAVEQRRGTVRTLRALGVPLGRIVALLTGELLGLALVAGALGLALGYAVAGVLLPGVSATLRGLYGADVPGVLSFRAPWALAGLGMAVAGTLVATGSSLAALAREPILGAATRRLPAVQAARRARRMGVVGVGLLAVAGAATQATGLVAAFVALGALLLGGAALLPWLLDRALAFGARRARAPLAGWAWADARAELPGLTLALMALLLALAANVGVTTMVSSFRDTFRAYLDQRLAAELYLQAPTPEEAEALLARLPDGARTLPIASVPRDLAGQAGEVMMLRDDATYRDDWPLRTAVPEVWDRLAAGEGVLVNEQLAIRAGLGLGDPVEAGPGLVLTVLGVFPDYGNPLAAAVLAEPLFRATYPDAVPTRYAVRMDPAQVAGLDLPSGAAVDQAALKELSMQVFERTFLVTAALNGLTLGVAGVALLLSLLSLGALRLPQLAPLWAMGVGRGALGWLELGRALLLAALTAVLALPLGLALAWVLLAVVNPAAFGWRLPLIAAPGDWLRLGALALGAAGLAAAWPAWRLARTPPARLVQVFASDR